MSSGDVSIAKELVITRSKICTQMCSEGSGILNHEIPRAIVLTGGSNDREEGFLENSSSCSPQMSAPASARAASNRVTASASRTKTLPWRRSRRSCSRAVQRGLAAPR